MSAENHGVGWGGVGAVGAATSGVTGASLAAVSAACCTGPVLAPMVVAVLGAGGGAWAASLQPYTPYLFGVSAALLAFGFHTVYRRRDGTCPVGGGGKHMVRRVMIAALWLAAAVWLGSVALAVYATYFDNPYV